MRESKQLRSHLRAARFERFEERLALSADPLTELLPQQSLPPVDVAVLENVDAAPAELVNDGYRRIMTLGEPDFRLNVTVEGTEHPSTLLNGVHNLTGVNYAYQDFGLTGRGQTVAVIDSGVWYNHQALGGGFGTGYRVVGGYDFAENDADPNDDGPAGFHGTHVAGIIGSDNAGYRGVSPDVDIVALRVFDDDGNGYFHWVEQALQWVHDHRDDFENPITAVNLSLGAEWNSSSIPSWANLEEEFAQLEEDGIFISVAAGNSFTRYNTSGLAYPAASPFVVPVSSVNDNGLMSSFSQRHDRVLAAPGSSIISTVPDYTFGADGIHNDFGGASGTSMAAPYVAGASVLLREAMQFAGVADINQDSLYDHLRSTADIFFDTATSANYHRINLRTAIDALIGEDDFGSSALTAHDLGAIDGAMSLSGSISRLDDADFFRFTAGSTGELQLSVAESHNLDATWRLVGGATSNENHFTIDVIAGQSYTFSLATTDGIGHYDITAELAGSASDWGLVEFVRNEDVSVSGQDAYQIRAARDGWLTVEAMFDHSAGDLNLELRGGDGELLGVSAGLTDNERLDYYATAGQTLLLHVSGANDNVDFRLTNLVQESGDDITVHGFGDDRFTLSAGTSTHELTVHGVAYTLSAGAADSITFVGGDGDDRIDVTGSSAAGVFTTSPGSVSLIESGLTVTASSMEEIHLYAGSAGDIANLHGDSGNDEFAGDHSTASLTGDGYAVFAYGFARVNAHGHGGADNAVLHGSEGVDQFYGRSTYAFMMGSGYLNQVIGFQRVEANAGQSHDIARLFDSAGADHFYGRASYSFMMGPGFLNIVNHFSTVNAYSSAGNDVARIFDSPADDLFVGRAAYSFLQTSDSTNTAFSFPKVYAFSHAGDDEARLYDTAGDETFVGRRSYAFLSGEDFLNNVDGFDRVAAYSSGGFDTAQLYDGPGDDALAALPQVATLGGVDFNNSAYGFDSVMAFASTGSDTAELFDSGGDDAFYGRPDYAFLQGEGFLNTADGFDRVDAYGFNGGNDVARLFDSSGDDRFYGRSEYSFMMGDGYLNIANGFDATHGYAGEGYDRAYLFDTEGDERFYGRPTYAFLQGDNFLNVANTFDRVEAYSSGGVDRAEFTDSAGRDAFYGREAYSFMMGDGFINIAHQFTSVTARSTLGGDDRAFLYGSAGDDHLGRDDGQIHLRGVGFDNRAHGFSQTRAYGLGGDDTAELFGLGDNHSLRGRGNYLTLNDGDEALTIYDFEDVDAHAVLGGDPDQDIQSVDYVFEELGE